MDKPKSYVWDVLALFLLVAVIFLFVGMGALSSWKASFGSARMLTITAQGMTTASPDMAEISFSVVTQGKDPQALSDDNNTKMGAVMKSLAAQGIAATDITTTGYNLQPNYIWHQELKRNTIDGYTLTQTVQVKIRDLAKVATILGGLAPLGVNEISSVNYTFQDPNKFTGLARADALTKASKQASEMAAQAGAVLGEVITISETPNIPYPMPAYLMNAGMGSSVKEAVTPTLAPGTQDVTDSVTVVYALR